MANIDQLSIEITSDSHKAEAAINDLVRGLTNLENTLNRLDVSKITQFTNAVNKLSNIGANTNTTTKAIKGMANEIAGSFGIRTKKGISDITEALMQLYEVNRNQKLGFDVGAEYDTAVGKVQKAIEANFKYKTSVDSTTQSVKDYVMATNKAGQTIGMADMAQEYGENFKEMAKVLGSAFKNKLDSTKEGVSDLAEYLSEMNSQLGTQFDVDNVEKGFAQLVETVRNAKSEILDYDKATQQGLVSQGASYHATVAALQQIEDLLKEQEKYGATNGLGGVISAFQQLSSYSDLSGLNNSLKDIKSNPPTETAKAVSEIGDSADRATAQVEKLNTVLSQSKTVIEGNEIKEHGFTMTDAPEPKNVQYPPAIIEQAQAYEEKLLPAIIDTQNQIDILFERMMNLSSTEAVYDAITQKFVEMKMALMEMNGAISGDKWVIPEFKGNADFSRQQTGWISNIKQDVVEGYYYEIEDSANACLPAVIKVGETALATSDQFKNVELAAKKAYETTAESFDGLEIPFLNDHPDNFFYSIEEGAKTASSQLEQLLERIRTLKEYISNVESGKIPLNEDDYKNAIRGYEEATNQLKEFKNEVNGKVETTTIAEVAERLLQLGEAFEKLSKDFGALADKGIRLFNILLTPLKHATDEYVEKFKRMGDAVANFQKNFKAHMAKVSAFWKRTMKTFTFMLVRKAFTAIIKEVGNAIQSLAMYSNAMGTAFNTDISNMVADFQYLGRSIVSVFAPILNAIAPIIDAIVSKIATLLSYIGMLFAALGGSASFTKAKKNVSNYAESLDSASKSAKNLTMGIDELNILNDSKSGGSSKPYDGWEDAWEDVKIPDWINDLSDKIKNIFKDLFEPIKKGWALAKDYILDGWKFMTQNMKKLLRDVWRDFIKVWKSDTVVHIFYNLFMILGDIERVIGFIAKRFDEAWNEGKKGYIILSNIAKIVDILVQHLRNVTLYMVGWAARLDFNPLLESLENLTEAFKDLAEFIGQVFEDVMKRVVLKYLTFLIEEGIPHLQNTIAEVLSEFDFEKIRNQLRPLEDAFERLLENLDVGATNAIGNLGTQIAEFTDSEEFQKFIDTIIHMMDSISAEDVEKILTGIGEGLLGIGDALVKFVGSESFNAFIDDLDKWLENASSEDIAGILEKIAIAIGMFKFAEFASAGLSGFLTFAGALKAFSDIGAISTNLGLLGEELGLVGAAGTTAGAGGTAAASGIGAMAAPAAVAALVIAAVVAAVYSLVKSFGGLDGLLMELRGRFAQMCEVADKFAKAIGLDKAIEKLKNAFDRLKFKLGDLKDVWDVVLDVLQFFGSAIVMVVEVALVPFIEMIANGVNWIATFVDALGGVGTILKSIGDGIVSGDWSGAWDGVKEGASRIKDAFVEGVTGGVSEEVSAKTSTSLINGFSQVPETTKSAIDEASSKIALNQSESYTNAIKANESIFSSSNSEVLTNAINGTDFSTSSDLFSSKTLESLTGSVENQDYSGLADVLGTKMSDSVLADKDTFNEANAETATSGAEKFNTEYLDFFTNNTEMTTTMEKYGKESIAAFNKGMQEEIGNQSISKSVLAIFKQINDTSKAQLAVLKGNLATNISLMISQLNFTSSITMLFNKLSIAITTNIGLLGTNLQTTLDSFMETYILPYFGEEKWQPLFDSLLNNVLIVFFAAFRTWFTEEAMTPWWKEDLLSWFADDKWNEAIFDPLQENIQGHWDEFSSWWDTTMTEWWEAQLVPWFAKEKWKEQFMKVHDTLEDVLKKVLELLNEAMDKAKETVLEACETMQKAVEDVGAAIVQVLNSLKDFDGFNGKVTFDFGGVGEFAAGGYPSAGSLFIAGEAGPEFVSSIGGRTGVVSNDEITGIADAVYTTGYNEAELLGQLVTIARAVLDKDPVVIGDREIARMANSGQSKLGMSIIT